MNPLQPNTNAGASGTEAEAIGLTNTPTDASSRSSNPSAPLLPPSPYNPEMMDLEPPSYDSIAAQDASDLENRLGSSSTGSLHQAYNKAPYPTGPGLHSVATSQPPYPTESGYEPGPASQAQYPMVQMPMPGRVDYTQRQIGFIAPVMMQPKSSDQGTIENRRYRQSTRKDVMNQYSQQQPNTVHVTQNNGQRNNDDEPRHSGCCVECCSCLCTRVTSCATDICLIASLTNFCCKVS